MHRLCSFVNRVQGSLPEVDTQWMRAKISPFNSPSTGFCASIFKDRGLLWTRLSCHRFRGNEVRLWLSVIAYNLGNLWRRLALPTKIGSWSLTSLRQRLVKTGGRPVKHARYYWLLLAEGHLTRQRLAACCGGSLRRRRTGSQPGETAN